MLFISKIVSTKRRMGPLVVIGLFLLSFALQKFINSTRQTSLLINPGFTLKESSQITNFHFRHGDSIPAKRFKNIYPWLKALGSSVAVADVNNDGFQDVFLNDSSPNNEHALFINNKKGKFENQTINYHLNQITTPNTSITRAIFFDCNNDNFPDLFLMSNTPKLLLNHQGKYFEDITEKSGLPKKVLLGFAVNVFDYNHDKNLDLIWGSYFENDIFSETGPTIGILPYNFQASKNKAELYLFKGDGNCHFTDESFRLPTDKLRGWYFSIGIEDLYQRGKQDIFIASDFGIDHLLLEDETKNKWNDRSSLIDQPSLSKNGMGVIFSDVSHTRNAYAYTSNIFRNNEHISGNLLWKFSDKNSNSLDDIANDYKISNCGWSWGSQFIDLNMDGWDDLVVANGFFGNNKQKSYWYNISVLEGTNRNLISDYHTWPDMTGFQLEGGQRDCIFLNNKKEKNFEEVTLSTEFDNDHKNGRGVAYIDINNDGNYSLILTNQNDIAHIYQVTATNEHNWIGISLTGTKSNLAGIGAKIYWGLSDGTKSYKEMRPITGFSSQNDPRFRLAFPKSVSLNELYIIWPTQKRQNIDLKSLKLNSYQNIVEELN